MVARRVARLRTARGSDGKRQGDLSQPRRGDGSVELLSPHGESGQSRSRACPATRKAGQFAGPRAHDDYARNQGSARTPGDVRADEGWFRGRTRKGPDTGNWTLPASGAPCRSQYEDRTIP